MPDKDDNLEQDTLTPVPGSQPEDKTEGSDSDISNDAEGQSPEEVFFNSLSGNSQERFRKAFRSVSEKESLLETTGKEAEYWKKMALDNSNMTPPPPPGQGSGSISADDPQVKEAVTKLRGIGLATQEDVDKKISEGLNGIRYQYELERLEKSYDGGDGRPQFDKLEYENFIKSHPQYGSYFPEDVYQIMFKDELVDWEVDNRSDSTPSKSKSLKPSKASTQQSDQLTPEYIEDKLRQPGGREWYEKNIDKVNETLGRLAK
jgi:hypothetical protein